MNKNLFPDMYEGIKEFEMRVYNNEVQYYQDDDTVTIEDEMTRSFFTAVMTRVNYFCSIDDAFEIYDYKKFVPHAMSKENAKELYEKIPNFKEEAINHGVLVFKLTRISEIIE